MNTKMNNKSLGYVHDMQGIFFDYVIDTNRFNAFDNPAYSYESFKAYKKWEVVKVVIEGTPYLIADIKLLGFSYFRYIPLERRVLKSCLDAYEALDEMKAYSKLLGIKILDPLKYYLRGMASEIESLR